MKRAAAPVSVRSASTVQRAPADDQDARRTRVAEADVPVDAVLGRRLAHVVQDRRAVGDRLGSAPRAEGVAERVHVRVRSDAGVAEQVPGAADGSARLEDGVARPRAARLQVAARADAGQPGAHDQHVEVRRHARSRVRSGVHRRVGRHQAYSSEAAHGGERLLEAALALLPENRASRRTPRGAPASLARAGPLPDRPASRFRELQHPTGAGTEPARSSARPGPPRAGRPVAIGADPAQAGFEDRSWWTSTTLPSGSWKKICSQPFMAQAP